MIFPESVNSSVSLSIDEEVKRSFVFDFKTGQHLIQGGMVAETTKLQAVEQWIELMLRTTLDKYAVYRDTVFGHTAEKYIGYRELPFGFIESELEREIREACTLNPAIETLSDFKVVRTVRGLDVTFNAHLKDKEILKVVHNGGLQ